MRIIKPSFVIDMDFDPKKVLKKLEMAGRTAYKSEDKIDEDSAKKFVKKMLNFKHESVIEHYSITVRIICDRGISHEIVRHRLASYTQECVSGDTVIKGSRVKSKNITIKELYDQQEKSVNGKAYVRKRNIFSIDSNNNIVKNKSMNILNKGPNEVYEVITKNGYSIKVTKNHEFFTNTGYLKLDDLEVGNSVYVNGRNKIFDDKDVSDLYIIDGYNATEIAQMYNCSASTVRSSLKRSGVFKSHKNDKNKDKYQKNHTSESFEKISKSKKEKYASGEHEVWNKGLIGYSCTKGNYVGNRGKYGKDNSNYKNGSNIGCYRRLKDGENCEMCNTDLHGKFEIHHVDRDRKNNIESNLMRLCRNCHSVQHHGWHVKTDIFLDEIISIKLIGVEDTYDISMNGDNHNYIANGFVVHNSTRYVNYSKGKFNNEIAVIDPIFWDVSTEKGKAKYDIWKSAMESAERSYMELLKAGAKPQEARSVLPNSLKTEIVVTMNLRSWRHFFKLRCNKSAHPQIREIAIPMLAEFDKMLPVVFEDLIS